MRVIQLKITSLIRFTQGHEVSVADFYLELVGEKIKGVSKSCLGCQEIINCRNFSDLFLTSSTSPNNHRLGVQKGFRGHRKFTGKSQENQ